MADETAILESVAEQPLETELPAAETTTPPETTDKRPDGRLQADAVRKALKFLRENKDHSGVADRLGRDLSDVASYRKFFEKVGNAREVSQALSSVGGVEKLAELQTYAANMREVDEMLESGDPRVVDRILETGASGIVKILPAMLEKLQASNPREMSSIAQPLARSFMEEAGFPDTVDGMVGIFNDASLKPEEKLAQIGKFLSGVVNWYKGLGGKEGPKTDPERQSFEQERESWNQKRYDTEIGDVFNSPDGIMAYAQKKIDARLLGDAKKLGFGQDSEYIDLLRQDIWKVVEKQRNNDQFFKADRDTKFNQRTRKVSQDAKGWMNGFTDKYLDTAYKQIMAPRMKSVSPVAPVKTSPTTAPSNAAPIMDPQATIQKAGGRDQARTMMLSGKGFTKDGKPIQKVGGAWRFAS